MILLRQYSGHGNNSCDDGGGRGGQKLTSFMDDPKYTETLDRNYSFFSCLRMNVRTFK